MDALHLWILTSFAVTQPLLDVLGRQPEFFVARAATPGEVLGMVVFLIIVLPAALIGLEALAGLGGRRARAVLHQVFVGLLLLLIALPVAKRLVDVQPVLTLAFAVLLAAIGVMIYSRGTTGRFVVSLLAPAPLMFATLFLLGTPVRFLMWDTTDSEAKELGAGLGVPVVMVVFDEMPVASLVNPDLSIDATRYPNLAALANRAMWFPNTTTAHAATHHAVPAILTGRQPEVGDTTRLATAVEHPRSLFTALGASHRIESFEAITEVCPETLCGHARPSGGLLTRSRQMATDLAAVGSHIVAPTAWSHHLAPVGDRWGGFTDNPRDPDDARNEASPEQGRRSLDQVMRFRTLLGTFEDGGDPTLYFLHSLLPHKPWQYLPSGKRYTNSRPAMGLDDSVWSEDEYLPHQGLQRHLLQLQFTDRLMGELIHQLEELELFDDAVIVVTADHGIAFTPGLHHRSLLDLEHEQVNGPDIARVPLLIKAPRQHSAIIDDRPVSTLDILPTLIDLLDVDVAWEFDGVSLVDEHLVMPPDRPRWLTRRDRMVPLGAAATEIRAGVDRIHRLFGLADGQIDAWAWGPGRELIGSAVSSLDLGPSDTLHATVDGSMSVGYDPEAVHAPTWIAGHLLPEAGDAADERIDGVHIAVAVQGRVAGVGRTYTDLGQRGRFSILAREDLFTHGTNQLALYVIEGRAGAWRLGAIPVTDYEPVDDQTRFEIIEYGDGDVALRTTGGRQFAVVRVPLNGGARVRATEQGLRIAGWAADGRSGRLVDRVVIFHRGTQVASARTTVERPDVVRLLGNTGLSRSGFRLEVPHPAASWEDVRVFALIDSFAAELRVATAGS